MVRIGRIMSLSNSNRKNSAFWSSNWPCFSRTPSLYHSTTMSGSPTGTSLHSKWAGSFSINLVAGFIGVLNFGGRGLSFWNMSSGGSSPARAYEGTVGAEGALSGGSLQENSDRQTWVLHTVGGMVQWLEHQSLTGGLSLTWGWLVTTLWVNRPIWVNQPGHLSLLSRRGR